MSFRFIFKIALRYFGAKKNNRLVSFIAGFSLLGVMLGVAALIVVMAVMQGFHIELTESIIGLNGDINLVGREKGKITEYKQFTHELQASQYIKKTIPQVYFTALAVSGDRSVGVMVRGMEQQGIIAKEKIVGNVKSGNINDIDKGFNVALGEDLAYSLRAEVGDEVAIICPNTVSTIMGQMPRIKKFKVAAIFASGRYDYDSATMLVNLNSAQKLFSYDENSVNLIEIYTGHPDHSVEIARKLTMGIAKNYYVSTWYHNNAQLLNALRVERIAMFTILSLIILVAAFNIISSLFMLVNEKNKDIAILKTIGATSYEILAIFMINGSLIGIIGTFLGVILGISFAVNVENIKIMVENLTGQELFESAIYILDHLPSKVEVSNVIYVSTFSFITSILATIYPAMKAARLDPAEIIRNE